MTDKAKLKGLRPLLPTTSLTTPLMTLSPVIGACNSNRIYRAEEATAPTDTQTPPPLISAPPVVLFPQPMAWSPRLVPVIPPLSLSSDNPVAEPHNIPNLPAHLGAFPAPPVGLLQVLAGIPLTNPPDKGGQGARETLPEPYRDLPEQHRDVPSPLALPALTSEMQQRLGEVAFQIELTPLDLNQDEVINPQDAQILYYIALATPPPNLAMLLENLRGTVAPEELTTAANAWLAQAPNTSPLADLNNDGSIDLQDVRVLYYALRFEDILRASASLRETLLSGLTTEDDAPGADRDGVYLAMLDSAAALRVREPTLGNIDLTELSAADGFIIQGDAANDQAGYSVSGAGDVNGDGYADLIVGANQGGDGDRSAGEAYVVFGKASGPSDPFGSEDSTGRRVVDLTNLAPGDGFIIQGDVAGDQAGYSVSAAGDVNGDGYADLLVGAYRGDDGGSNAGEAYLVFGRASGPSDPQSNPFGREDSTGRRVVDLTSLVAGDGFIIQGDAEDDNAGVSVSGAGDVNGDGYADLLVGAIGGHDGGIIAGEAYVVFGKASDFGDDVSNTLEDGTMVDRRVVDLTNLAPADGFIIQGDEDSDRAGRRVSGAGDVNGDGYADLIIGAHYGEDGGRNAGEAYVVFGKASGFGDNVINDLDDGTTVVRRVIDLTSLVATDGFIIQGDESNDEAGVSVSGAGDVNGDGYADLIVGALRADVNTPDVIKYDAGEAYVVFGKASGFGREVINVVEDEGDFPRQVVDLTRLAAGDGFIIQGNENGYFFRSGDYAGVSVSGAGDVNGDGYADLLVGANFADVNTPDGTTRIDAGAAYVVFGKASGFGREVINDVEDEGAFPRQVVDLGSLATGDGFIIQGDEGGVSGGISNTEVYGGDRAGYSVSAGGDVNGDGFADLIVGAYNADVNAPGNTRTNAGEAYVLFGGRAGLSTEAAAVLGTDGNDELNGNGRSTVVLAGAGDDVLNIDGFGATDLLKFDGGAGADTLRLSGADLSLNLRTLADTRLSSIERIDLSGSGDNSLTLTRLDLLNLSEVRTNGRAELRVDGNTGDSVTADDDGWVQQADDNIDGTTYRVFDNGNARLLVNIDVSPGGNLMATSRATMAEVLQKYAAAHTVDIRALIEDLPPEDEQQKRKRLDDELAMLGPLPAAKQAMELTEPTAVAEPDADLFDLPPLIPDDG